MNRSIFNRSFDSCLVNIFTKCNTRRCIYDSFNYIDGRKIHSRPSIHDEVLAQESTSNEQQISQFHLNRDCKQSLFMLDNQWTYLNHGAFGASLRMLHREAENWRNLTESQPLRFYDRILTPIDRKSVV